MLSAIHMRGLYTINFRICLYTDCLDTDLVPPISYNTSFTWRGQPRVYAKIYSKIKFVIFILLLFSWQLLLQVNSHWKRLQYKLTGLYSQCFLRMPLPGRFRFKSRPVLHPAASRPNPRSYPTWLSIKSSNYQLLFKGVKLEYIVQYIPNNIF